MSADAFWVLAVFAAYLVAHNIAMRLDYRHLEQAYAAAQEKHVAERTALMDRIQAPDLSTYYGARAAYHPEDFPAVEEPEFVYDEFGYVQDEKRPGAE